MNQFHTYILSCFIALYVTLSFSQGDTTNNSNFEEEQAFIVRGSIIEGDTYKPISKVKIEVNGSQYTTSDNSGQFRVRVKIGDQLTIRHNDFDTVYYTITNDERIQVRVELNKVRGELNQGRRKISRPKSILNKFKASVDSADRYLKIDAEKSINFITEALGDAKTKNENAESYEVLADIYSQWKQYDLAISNYKISLQNLETNIIKLKLARAYELNGNYEEGIETYNAINKQRLSNWEEVMLYEGLADIFNKQKNYDLAIKTYQLGLEIAEKHLITPKITDLNSKIAKTYDAKGESRKAEGFFENALSLASKENKKRAIRERITVADFQNKNQDYDQEIELRKQVLLDFEDIKQDSIINNESALTPQKQNYKIGSAYALQNDFENAIPYLEKSIEEASENEDLVVEKDATRKISEIYNEVGEVDKALSAINKYESLVDELYIKKEQEISQAANFGRRIAESQNRILSLENERKLSLSNYELTAERNKSQRLIIYSLIGGLLLLLVSAYAMFKYIKQQKLSNNLLALKSLRSQMNPHFIFNALNSVNSFIATNDERAANKYLSDFSLLMRAVLENSEESFIPLEKEIELLQLYTKLEHSRFKDKFEYFIEVDKNVNIYEFQIPPMLLQPYIENAVWHGLRYKINKGRLSITISQVTTDQITITVADDGIGRDRSKALKTQNQQKQNSKGMGNIKKRVAILNQMYKDKIDVFIENFQDAEDAGTKVVVTLKKD